MSKQFQDYYPQYFNSLGTIDSRPSFTSFQLKGEIRELGKLFNDEVRGVMCVATESILVGDKYDLAFNVNFKDRRPCWSALGVALTHRGFDNLVRCLDKKYNWELDAFRHEATFRLFEHEMIQGVRERVMRWRSPEEKSIHLPKWRDVARVKCTGPIVFSDGTVRLMLGSQKSGHWSPLPDNTLDTALRMFAFYALLGKRSGHGRWPEHGSFWRWFSFICLGDDLNISTCMREFTFQQFKLMVLNEFKLVFSTPCESPRAASELSFLSVVPSLIGWDGEEHYLPVHEFEKSVSSMFYNNEDVSVLSTVQRLCNIRINAWPSMAIRRYCDQLIDYIVRKYRNETQEWRDVMKSYLSPRELDELWMSIGAGGIPSALKVLSDVHHDA